MAKTATTFKEIAVANKWIRIMKEGVLFESGTQGEYLVVERNPALMLIVLIEKSSKLYTYIVKQYRYPIGAEIWQFPMGSVEGNDNILDGARIELKQETGVIASDLKLIAEYFVDPGLSRQKCFVFVADNVTETGQQELEESEHGMIARCVSIDELDEMVNNGELNDGWGYTGYYLLRRYLAQR
jgi:ADP-ribose pyrophosphatase